MGRKLDFLLGRSSKKSSKIKILLNLTVSRLAVLRNHRQARCSQARCDVAQLLHLGHLDRALLRAEQVIKEQDMLDLFVMLENYCSLLTERVVIMENQKVCPEELREAISSLVFAASRCGDLPELHEARAVFASKFGKDFVASAVELRNECGVNPNVMQKLSTREPSLESKQKVTKEIATEKGIKLECDESSPEILEKNQRKVEQSTSPDVNEKLSNLGLDEYKDVATAAQAAFESAAYAAAAARVAVELSRSESQGKGSGDQSLRRSKTEGWKRDQSESFEKTHHVQNYKPEAEEGIYVKDKGFLRKALTEKFGTQLQRSSSSSSSDSTEISPKETNAVAVKQHFSYLHPPYQRSKDDGKVPINREIGTVGLGPGSRDNAEARAESSHLDSMDKLHKEHLNVARKAMSMRTRRGV
ncbi:uncharacterized protein [Typha latifolia]|uniref:uncharacterized protein n=1 Tax=Typha latifolia TaxID=4733 RepID=UPI003C2E593F